MYVRGKSVPSPRFWQSAENRQALHTERLLFSSSSCFIRRSRAGMLIDACNRWNAMDASGSIVRMLGSLFVAIRLYFQFENPFCKISIKFWFKIFDVIVWMCGSLFARFHNANVNSKNECVRHDASQKCKTEYETYFRRTIAEYVESSTNSAESQPLKRERIEFRLHYRNNVKFNKL